MLSATLEGQLQAIALAFCSPARTDGQWDSKCFGRWADASGLVAVVKQQALEHGAIALDAHRTMAIGFPSEPLEVCTPHCVHYAPLIVCTIHPSSAPLIVCTIHPSLCALSTPHCVHCAPPRRVVVQARWWG